MPLYLGSQKLKELYVGGQKIKEAWMLVGGVLRKVYSSFLPMGAMRAADGSIIATTPTKTVGWVANPEFPGSVIVSNGIQVNGTKAAVLKFSGTFYWSWTGAMNIAAFVNGVQRGETHSWNYPNGYVNTPHSGSIPISVAAGEVVDLYFWAAIGFAVTIRADAKWSVE